MQIGRRYGKGCLLLTSYEAGYRVICRNRLASRIRGQDHFSFYGYPYNPNNESGSAIVFVIVLNPICIHMLAPGATHGLFHLVWSQAGSLAHCEAPSLSSAIYAMQRSGAWTDPGQLRHISAYLSRNADTSDFVSKRTTEISYTKGESKFRHQLVSTVKVSTSCFRFSFS